MLLQLDSCIHGLYLRFFIMCISGTRTYIYWDRNGKFFGQIKDVGVWVRTPGGHIHPKTVAGLTYGVPTASHRKSTKSQYHRTALTGLLKTGWNNGIFEIWNIRRKFFTTPGHNKWGFLRKVQNHVYEAQTASGCDPHSPGGLVGWTRAFCKPPRKKMALGKANCPQPITIQLPPPAGSKPAQMRIT
jgi:hypothetical protein